MKLVTLSSLNVVKKEIEKGKAFGINFPVRFLRDSFITLYLFFALTALVSYRILWAISIVLMVIGAYYFYQLLDICKMLRLSRIKIIMFFIPTVLLISIIIWFVRDVIIDIFRYRKLL